MILDIAKDVFVFYGCIESLFIDDEIYPHVKSVDVRILHVVNKTDKRIVQAFSQSTCEI
jgi:hypothetical protein